MSSSANRNVTASCSDHSPLQRDPTSPIIAAYWRPIVLVFLPFAASSVYFLTFAAIQLPLGVLLDRFGPRRVQTGLLLFAAVGAALFARSNQFTALVVGRALIAKR